MRYIFIITLMFALSSPALLPETQRNFEADDLIRKRDAAQRQDRNAQVNYARSLEARNAALLEEMAKPPVHFAHYANPPIRQISGSKTAAVPRSEPIFSIKTMLLLAVASFGTAFWAMRLADHAKKKA